MAESDNTSNVKVKSAVHIATEKAVTQTKELCIAIQNKRVMQIILSIITIILLLFAIIITLVSMSITNLKTEASTSANIHSIQNNAKWKQNGTTVATGDRFYHNGIYVDDDQTIYIAQEEDHSVVKWKYNTNRSQVVVGGNGCGDEPNQFDNVGDISFDRYANLYVVDEGNNRVQKFLVDPY